MRRTTLGAGGGHQTESANGVSVNGSIGGTAHGASPASLFDATVPRLLQHTTWLPARPLSDHDHFVSVSGTLTVAGGGAGMSAGSDAQSNAQPTFILNQIIKL